MKVSLLLAVLMNSIVLAGCGGGEAPETEAVGTTGPSSAEVASVESRSACELVTTDEVAAIAGELVEARPGDQGDGYSACEFWGTTNEVPYLMLTVYWSGG